MSENRPHQPLHWAKILMKVTDLRTISTRHAERVLCIRLDNSGEIPPLLLEVFNEGHSSWPDWTYMIKNLKKKSAKTYNNYLKKRNWVRQFYSFAPMFRVFSKQALWMEQYLSTRLRLYQVLVGRFGHEYTSMPTIICITEDLH